MTDLAPTPQALTLEIWREDDTLDERALICLHEAGHAVILSRYGDCLGSDIDSVEIVEHESGVFSGHCAGVGWFDSPETIRQRLNSSPQPTKNNRHIIRRYTAYALLTYAGLTAEMIAGHSDAEIYYGEYVDGQKGHDLKDFEDCVSLLGYLNNDESNSRYSRYHDRLTRLVWQVLSNHWAAVEGIAGELYRRGSIKGDEVIRIFEAHGGRRVY